MISRETRKYVRKKIEPYYNAFREFKDKHLLFVLKDTENMERILLQKNAHFVTIPSPFFPGPAGSARKACIFIVNWIAERSVIPDC